MSYVTIVEASCDGGGCPHADSWTHSYAPYAVLAPAGYVALILRRVRQARGRPGQD